MGLTVATRPNPFDTTWASGILIFAALVLAPLALELLDVDDCASPRLRSSIVVTQLPAALSLAASYAFEQGSIAAALAVPWLAWTGAVGACGSIRLLRQVRLARPESCLHVAMAYLVVGGFWTFLSRAGMAPLGFKPVIVLLTGIHFHYAGFVLPIACGLAAERRFDRFAKTTCGLVLISVPLTALGITASQLGAPPFLETLSALAMTVGGVLLALLQLRAFADARPVPQAFATLSSSAVLYGMVFSAMYAVRFFGVAPWLDVPWMRVLHGTMNAFGFAPAALLAWVTRPARTSLAATDPIR